MQPIFRLVENGIRIGFKSPVVNFLAALGRQTMHNQRSWFGEAD